MCFKIRQLFIFGLLVLILVCVPFTWALATEASADAPFWKTKPAVRRKLLEERAVVVAVQKKNRQPKGSHFALQGAGIVSAPRAFSFQIAQQYEKLKSVSDHFKTVTYDKNTQKIFMIVSAMGYQARMVMQVRPELASSRSNLHWTVVDGHFKGMTGTMGFEEVSPAKTEVSIVAAYDAESLPLPQILMGFALEVVVQKVAEKMRSFIEHEYNSSK